MPRLYPANVRFRPKPVACAVALHRVLVPLLTFKSASFEKGFDVLGNGTAKYCNSDCYPNADLS